MPKNIWKEPRQPVSSEYFGGNLHSSPSESVTTSYFCHVKNKDQPKWLTFGGHQCLEGALPHAPYGSASAYWSHIRVSGERRPSPVEVWFTGSLQMQNSAIL